MSFEETYQAEVLLSRRARSQRALFWAKVVGFVLMLTVGATLRSEPQLRQAIFGLGMDAIKTAADTSPASRTAPTIGPSTEAPDMSQIGALLSQIQGGQPPAPQLQETVPAKPTTGFRDAVRVNRHGSGQSSPTPFQPTSDPGLSLGIPNAGAPDAGAMAVDLGKLMKNFMPGQ